MMDRSAARNVFTFRTGSVVSRTQLRVASVRTSTMQFFKRPVTHS